MKEDVLYEEILNAAPSRETVLIILKQMKSRGHLKEVIKRCHEFLRVQPDDLNLAIFLAECLISADLPAHAEKELQKVAQKMNSMARVYALLADIYRAQGRLFEASEAAGFYLAYNPDDAAALEIRNAFEQAEVERHQVAGKISSPADEPEAENLVDFATPTIAELYFNQGQLEAAVETYEKVLEHNPEDTESEKRLAQLKAEVKEQVKANEAVKQDRVRKEKIIRILESWLPKIKELRYG